MVECMTLTAKSIPRYGLTRVTVNILDGAWLRFNLAGHDDSFINIFGGSMKSVDACDNSQVAVFGGEMDELNADFEDILIVHGSDFAVDGTPFGYGELASYLEGGIMKSL